MKYCYGPVFSRRLGYSLGIDMIPFKKCSFDCSYCQLGVTTTKTIQRFHCVDLHALKKEVKSILARKPRIDYITLAGGGEPTLHQNLDKIIGMLKKISRRMIPVCVITNSSLLYRKEVRRELLEADLIIPSLDTVSEGIFKKLNCPHKGITIAKIINGLVSLRKEFKGRIWLEIMLIGNLNDTALEAKKMKKVIDRIDPDRIQLNIPVRPPAKEVKVPTKEATNRFARTLGRNVQVIDNREKKSLKQPIAHKIEKGVFDLLRRRPATYEELMNSFGLDEGEIEQAIKNLVSKKKIVIISQYRKRYYKTND